MGECPVSMANAKTSIISEPHPFNDETTLSIDNGEVLKSIKVFDLQEKEVLNLAEVNSTNFTLGKSLNKGIYIFQTTTNSAT